MINHRPEECEEANPKGKVADGTRWAERVHEIADDEDRMVGEVRMGCIVAGLFSLLACITLMSIVVVDLVAHFGPARREFRWRGTYAAIGLTVLVVTIVWLWLWRVSVSADRERKTAAVTRV